MDRLCPQWILEWLNIPEGKYFIEGDYCRTKINWDEYKDVFRGQPVYWAVESTDIASPKLYEPGFEALTGAEVDIIGIPPEVLQEKLMAEFVAGTGRYDGAELFSGWAASYYPYMLDMIPYFEKYDIPVEDLHPSFRFPFSGPQGEFLGLTFDADLMVGTYRMELLHEAGVDKAPRTWDEFLAAAAELDELRKRTNAEWYPTAWPVSAKGFSTFWNYIWIALGTMDDCTILKDAGSEGWVLDLVGKNSGGVEALQIYKEALKYAAPGAVNFFYGDFEESWLKGLIGMSITPQCIGMKCHDRERSTISPLDGHPTDIEVYPIPEGTTRRGVGLHHATVYGISNTSKNPDLAFLWAIYQCSQEAALVQTLAITGNECGYASVILDPEVWTLNTSYKAFAYQVGNAWNHPLAQLKEGSSIDELIGSELYKYVSGEHDDAQKALEDAQAIGNQQLQELGYQGAGAQEVIVYNTIDWCQKFNVYLPPTPSMDPWKYEGP
jgi:ABC-type glycerol-3-phosphate transport system substrate-binding protein